jgi:hypothetical protein
MPVVVAAVLALRLVALAVLVEVVPETLTEMLAWLERAVLAVAAAEPNRALLALVVRVLLS